MKRFVFGILGVLSLYTVGPVWAQTGLTVTINGISPTQAVLYYTAPGTSACTVTVSTSNTYSPVVIDNDPTLFTNANLDSRGGTPLGSGTVNRIYVIGDRITATGLDSNIYSRALQTNTLHYAKVVCGEVGWTGTFTTASVPAGNLRNDIPPTNSTGFWDIPTWTGARGQQIVDPYYGTLMVRETITSDWSGGSGSGLFQGSGGLTRPHTNKLFTSGDGKQGYVSVFWNDSAGGSMYFFIPSTGEVRYIGNPGGIINPVMRDDKTFLQYRSDLNPAGLYNIPYAGTFMPGDYTTGTPILNVADSSGGACGALTAYDSTRFPTPATTYACASVPTYANEYTTFFFQNAGYAHQDSPGVEGVMWGGDGRPYDPTCTDGPTLCPGVVAAYIIGSPSNPNGCVNHNNQLWSNDLVELNLKSADGSCPGGYAAVDFWHFKTDPNGTALANGYWGFGGHQDIGGPSPYTSNSWGAGPNLSVEESSSYCVGGANGCAYDGVAGYPQSSYIGTTTPTVLVGGYNAFAGAGYGGWGLVRHPNWEQDLTQTTAASGAAQTNTFFDSIPFGGAGGPGPPNDIDISSVTLVFGKTRTYKIGLFSALNRKQQDTVVKSAYLMFIDVSGTATNQLCDTSGCAGQYCIANAVNECVTGSSIGDIYINPWQTSFAFGCAGGEAPNLGIFDICILDSTTQLMMEAQLWGTGPGDGYLKSRMLGHGMAASSSYKQAGATVKPYPDTSWATFETGLFNTTIKGDVWAMKIPPYPTPDGIDRTTFVRAPVSLSVPSGHGIVTATIEFWYDRYSASGNYCTTRQEACVLVASTVVDSTPFWYKTTESGSYTRAACTTSCTITIPVLPTDTAHWVAKGYDSGGSYVMDFASGVAVEGTVTTLGQTPPTAAFEVGLAGELLADRREELIPQGEVQTPPTVAASPIGLGAGTPNLSIGLLQMLNWATAVPSGCSAGMGENCVGGSGVQGDTEFFSAWFSNGDVFGTLNSGQNAGCPTGGNILITQMSIFNWATPNASKMKAINCMTAYGGGAQSSTDTPSGWHGHCTNGDDGTTIQCTWKSRTPFVRNDVLYLPVERQIESGLRSIHDATFVKSTDHGATWSNPYTIAHSGTPSATGDAPTCDAASGSPGSNCTSSSYTGSIMWQALPFELSNWIVVQFGQDGTPPPAGAGVADGCDPNLYTCFIAGGQEGTIARVLNTDLPTLDVTKWQYYSCPTATNTYHCPGSDPASWTSTFAGRTAVLAANNPTGTQMVTFAEVFGIIYLPEFNSYLMSGWNIRNSQDAGMFMWAPSLQGPWTIIASTPGVSYGSSSTISMFPGFISPSPALGYTVVGTNPPHIKLTMAADDTGSAPGATPLIGQIDLVLGNNQFYTGDTARMRDYTGYQTNAGFTFSPGNLANTFNSVGLVWAFDFYDHAGDTTISDWGAWTDVFSGGASFRGCDGVYPTAYASPTSCGGQYPTHGAGFNQYGITTADSSSIPAGGQWRSLYSTFNAGQINAPAAMQGNGSYTVIEVVRHDAAAPFSRNGAMWTTGVSSSTANTMVEEGEQNGQLYLRWNSDSQPHYRYTTNFTFPNTTNWYYIATVVNAGTGGNCPVVNAWVGIDGSVVDENAGVTCTQLNGASTKTPAVGTWPLVIGINADGNTAGQSTAAMLIYNRALSYPEVQQAYQSMGVLMGQRGVTIQ